MRRDLLSDTRRVESLLHRRADRLGAVRLRQELGEKGIDRQEIDAALEGLKSTEPSRARQVLKKKFGALAGEASERGRQTRFLLSRGFATDTVRKALSAIDDDCDPDS